MTLTHCETGLLRRLAETPFADRLDLAALSGWSRGAVYAGMAKLAERGMASAIPHATPLLPPTRRYYLTAHGLRWLAEDEATSLDELLRRRPVSGQWQRVLLGRLDALAVIYRLANTISNAEFPMGFRWFRAAPVDAGIVLPDGSTGPVPRQQQPGPANTSRVGQPDESHRAGPVGQQAQRVDPRPVGQTGQPSGARPVRQQADRSDTGGVGQSITPGRRLSQREQAGQRVHPGVVARPARP